MPKIYLFEIFHSIGWHFILIPCFTFLIVWEPANIFIRFILKKRCDKKFNKDETKAKKVYDRVVQAGPSIGVLERSIVLLLVFLNQFEAIAWVMVAKGFIIQGIFQIHNLKHDEVEKITAEEKSFEGEAYLIGTLLSFLIAILGGVFLVIVLKLTNTPGIS